MAPEYPISSATALPEVCHACRKLKGAHLGSFHRVPSRYHDRRFTCFVCQEKRQNRLGTNGRSRRRSPDERAAVAALAQLGHRFIPEYKLGAFYFDFAIPALRLLIEIDSHTYHRHPSRRRRDKLKTMLAEQEGWTVSRISRPDIEGKVRLAIDRREGEVLGV